MQRPLRLRHSVDFARSRRMGRLWRLPLLYLSVVPNGLPHNRYGFITGKVIGGAVTRNRIRRQLRAIMRQMHGQLRSGYDLVWLTRNGIAGASYSQISAMAAELLQRASLLSAPPVRPSAPETAIRPPLPE